MYEHEIEYGTALRKAGKYFEENVNVSHFMIIHLLPLYSFSITAHASHTQYNIRTDVLSSDAVFMPTGRREDGADPQ